MRIELQNLKINASFSEETTCYRATVLIDGKRAFEASNDGHGGADFYRQLPGYDGPDLAAVNAWLAANLPPYEGHGMTLPIDLELHIADLIERHQAEKRLSAMMRKKLVIIGEHQGKPALFTLGFKPARPVTDADFARWRAERDQGKRTGQLVNGNAELIEQALALV